MNSRALRAVGLAAMGFSLAASQSSAGEKESREERTARHYAIGRVPLPAGVDPQVGGLDIMLDGRLVAAFHHGEVAILDRRTGVWTIFAEGLHEPLGAVAEPDGSVLVMQRPELTRLRDRDGDGVAESYETVWDGFGMTGNYHEFAFGPVRGPNGKLYVGLNTASNGAGIRDEIRGEWSPVGLEREKFLGDAKRNAKAMGRMYARVPWRGWIMEIDPRTGKAEPFASGFQSPDGLGFDAAGNFWVDDNQGDWRGTSEAHVVTRGGFHGHPASLVWRSDWDGTDPLDLPVERLNAMRVRPAIHLPHSSYANSPTQFAVIPRTPAWGALGGQLIAGEMNFPRLLRLLPEKVGGQWQGACVFLVESESLKAGLHRLVFAGDTLFIGRTHLSWVGAEGIGTLDPTGVAAFDPIAMRLTPRGFRFEFAEPLADDAGEPANWTADRYYYAYHSAYGSPQMEKAKVTPERIVLSADRRTADVRLASVEKGFLYDFDLARVRSAKGEAPLNPRIVYTVNALVER